MDSDVTRNLRSKSISVHELDEVVPPLRAVHFDAEGVTQESKVFCQRSFSRFESLEQPWP